MALLAAVLFGASTPLVQRFGAGVGRFSTAALLYAGAALVGASMRRPVDLWRNRRRPRRLVKALAQAHIDELEAKVDELQAMKATLAHLVRCCHGDERPDCPIIDTLASRNGAVASASKAVAQRSGLRTGRQR